MGRTPSNAACNDGTAAEYGNPRPVPANTKQTYAQIFPLTHESFNTN